MRVDLAIAGGGLAGALIAWRVRKLNPQIKIALIEQGETLGGNHTWSFHDTDLLAEQARWIDPLIVHRWGRQQVRFPAHQRTLRTGYRSITSERLHKTVASELGDSIFLNASIASVAPTGVTLANGDVIVARAVIDARGQRDSGKLVLGFQKFVGELIRFEHPHELTAPIIMDATVPQTDGYRFFYVLPFTEDTALVEDTYYADGAALDNATVSGQISDYCAAQGWKVAEVLRRESGILPIALAGDIAAHFDDDNPGVARAGLRAGLFHPLTGYSLPDAATLADLVATSPDALTDNSKLYALTRNHAISTWGERAFFRMLSRFLFDAAEPANRYRVMQRFYRLSEPLIERFYAARSLQRDKMRVLVGKPPVGFFKAFACIDEDEWVKAPIRMEL
jgi:lycopene beta-cyclase